MRGTDFLGIVRKVRGVTEPQGYVCSTDYMDLEDIYDYIAELEVTCVLFSGS